VVLGLLFFILASLLAVPTSCPSGTTTAFTIIADNNSYSLLTISQQGEILLQVYLGSDGGGIAAFDPSSLSWYIPSPVPLNGILMKVDSVTGKISNISMSNPPGSFWGSVGMAVTLDKQIYGFGGVGPCADTVMVYNITQNILQMLSCNGNWSDFMSFVFDVDPQHQRIFFASSDNFVAISATTGQFLGSVFQYNVMNIFYMDDTQQIFATWADQIVIIDLKHSSYTPYFSVAKFFPDKPNGEITQGANLDKVNKILYAVWMWEYLPGSGSDYFAFDMVGKQLLWSFPVPNTTDTLIGDATFTSWTCIPSN